jgi:hypothetical protein
MKLEQIIRAFQRRKIRISTLIQMENYLI